MKKLPKLMCVCGHMADAENNAVVCNNCWQTARLMLTGDGAHDIRAQVEAMEEVVEAAKNTLHYLHWDINHEPPFLSSLRDALAKLDSLKKGGGL